MINHFNFKEFGDEYLITNDFGRYAFISEENFKNLVRGRLDADSDIGQLLRDRLFVFDESDIAFLARGQQALRGAKKPLFNATTLHIFVMTTACNLDCVYCQAHSGNGNATRLMSAETAERAIDVALSSPSPALTFEFQGGEPLLNYSVIKRAIEYAESKRGLKRIRYTVVSNLSLLTDEMIEFFKEHNVGLSTSLDGPQFLHDGNRPMRNGGGSFDMMKDALLRARSAGLSVGGIQTTSRASLGYSSEIVDAYCELGFESLFIRPLTPLGVARSRWSQIGYTAKEFCSFYRSALKAILEKNKAGITLREGHASLLLEKILFGNAVNYMELRSPCGAGVGQLAYCANGDVFTCDEGRMLSEMGNSSFRLGNVYDNHSFSDFIQSPVCRAVCAASTLESIPVCCDCVYQPYCGICPVINTALESDLIPKTPNGYRCEVYREMFDAVFDIIRYDATGSSLLRSWFD